MRCVRRCPRRRCRSRTIRTATRSRRGSVMCCIRPGGADESDGDGGHVQRSAVPVPYRRSPPGHRVPHTDAAPEPGQPPSGPRRVGRFLQIDYSPIYGVSERLLGEYISDEALAKSLLEVLYRAAARIAGRPEAGGQVGRLFGELIGDRKFLATFTPVPPRRCSWRSWPSTASGWTGPVPRR